MSECNNASTAGSERADTSREASVGVQLSEAEWQRFRAALAEAADAFEIVGFDDVARTLSKIAIIAHCLSVRERQRGREAVHGEAPSHAEVKAFQRGAHALLELFGYDVGRGWRG